MKTTLIIAILTIALLTAGERANAQGFYFPRYNTNQYQQNLQYQQQQAYDRLYEQQAERRAYERQEQMQRQQQQFENQQNQQFQNFLQQQDILNRH